jgi:integrase/recombinase XerD
MPDASLLGPWVRRFLMEHLVSERDLARNTQRSYRDTLRLVLPDVSQRAGKAIERLAVTDLSADRVRQFLGELEEKRGCAIATRNQRLATIHALAPFIGLHAPELVEWCGQVRAVSFKKAPKTLVTYLEKAEMNGLLAAPDLTTSHGRRDHSLLLFLYNSGTRADEAAHVLIGDLQLGLKPERDPSSVLIRGKGKKLRRCPLWARTVNELTVLVHGRAEKEHVFLNRRSTPLTRFGIHTMVEWYTARVAKCLRWQPRGGARTPYGIRRQRTCCERGWTSARSAPGWGMWRWQQPTSTRRSIWR